ncbi:MAG: hypothetical protein WEB56_07530 [Roseovarius sp.]
MTTPEPKATRRAQPATAMGWREIIPSNAECAQAEGFALEQLIDWQRDCRTRPREGR